MAFAVEVGLDAFLPNNLVAQSAQNVFYDTLRILAPDFYDDLQESGAFSFYYLCVRDGRHVARRVGENFASLCGRPGSESYARMGEDLYSRFIAQVKRLTCRRIVHVCSRGRRKPVISGHTSNLNGGRVRRIPL